MVWLPTTNDMTRIMGETLQDLHSTGWNPVKISEALGTSSEPWTASQTMCPRTTRLKDTYVRDFKTIWYWPKDTVYDCPEHRDSEGWTNTITVLGLPSTEQFLNQERLPDLHVGDGSMTASEEDRLHSSSRPSSTPLPPSHITTRCT